MRFMRNICIIMHISSLVLRVTDELGYARDFIEISSVSLHTTISKLHGAVRVPFSHCNYRLKSLHANLHRKIIYILFGL
jgi:hypothetical protein